MSALDPAGSPYSGIFTIAAASAVNGSYTVSLTFNVFAGQPSLNSVFPTQVNAILPGATATSNFIFTLAGQNFFTTSAVSLQQGTCAAPTGQSYPLPQPTYLSRQVLQVSVNPGFFAQSTLGSWFLKVGIRWRQPIRLSQLPVWSFW